MVTLIMKGAVCVKILIVEPGKHPRKAEINHTLEEMRGIVGGPIQAVYPWNDPVALVCDEEGLYKDTPWNRYICEGMAIKGTFFICGLGREDFSDLPDSLAAKYKKLLYYPQMFVNTPDGIAVISMP